MPRVGFLCFGHTAAPANIPTLVVTTNSSCWGQLTYLEQWTKAARNNTLITMPPAVKGRITPLTRKAKQHGGPFPPALVLGPLQTDWNNAAPGAKDTAVMTAWNNVCALPGPPGPPPINPVANRTLLRPLVTEAMPFDPRVVVAGAAVMPAMPRCRRCRIVFRYNMAVAPVTEPELFDSGPYSSSPLSCAEVGAYDKCGRWGL